MKSSKNFDQKTNSYLPPMGLFVILILAVSVLGALTGYSVGNSFFTEDLEGLFFSNISCKEINPDNLKDLLESQNTSCLNKHVFEPTFFNN